VSVTAQTLRTGKQTTVHKTFRDSLTMDVLRHGRVSIGYIYYYPNSTKVPEHVLRDSLLPRIDEFFGVLLHDTLIRATSAELVGSASIDGPLYYNKEMARQRVASLKKFLDQRYQLSSYVKVETKIIDEDWDGLVESVRKTSLTDLPQREEVLQIIREIPVVKGREAALMRLDGGRAYRYIKKHFLAYQRRSVITLVCDVHPAIEKMLGRNVSDSEAERIVANTLLPDSAATRLLQNEQLVSCPVQFAIGSLKDNLTVAVTNLKKPLITLADTVNKLKPIVATEGDTISQSAVKTQQTTEMNPLQKPDMTKTSLAKDAPFRPYVAIKTDLVSLAGVTNKAAYRTPMPNLEVEYLFNRRFSAAFSGLYERFFKASGYDLWHVSAYTLEGRYRILPDKQYGGLYLGVYGRVGDYNIRNAGSTDNYTGMYTEGGLSAGYTLPIARNWVLEGGISGGYRHTNARYYMHEAGDVNYLLSEKPFNKFMLTSFFLRIGYRFGWK
jgi:hypothetical protein